MENFVACGAKLPKNSQNLGLSQRFWEVAETKFSAGLSRVTGPTELNEMVQYLISFI